MAQLPMHCPFDERHLDDNLGPHPMRAETREPFRSCKRRGRNLECVEPGTKLKQKFRVEAGADFSCEHEIVVVEVANQQGTQADACALRIREAADHELL